MSYTSDDAKTLLNSFFKEMNSWGRRAIEKFNPEGKDAHEVRETLRVELKGIFEKYVTPRERKMGRIEVMQISLGQPDYDPLNELVEEIKPSASGFDVITRRNYPSDDYHETYKYKIKSTKDDLLIDSRERYSDFESKWVKDII